MIDKQRFAELLFEADRAKGLYLIDQSFDDIPAEEQDLFLANAELYMSLPTSAWPDHIREAA
jgi:hypothetical protein